MLPDAWQVKELLSVLVVRTGHIDKHRGLCVCVLKDLRTQILYSFLFNYRKVIHYSQPTSMKKIQKPQKGQIKEEVRETMSLVMLHPSASLAPSFPKGENQICGCNGFSQSHTGSVFAEPRNPRSLSSFPRTRRAVSAQRKALWERGHTVHRG